eukprot:13495694-Alexandrium_andersonii.AAC.1
MLLPIGGSLRTAGAAETNRAAQHTKDRHSLPTRLHPIGTQAEQGATATTHAYDDQPPPPPHALKLGRTQTNKT